MITITRNSENSLILQQENGLLTGSVYWSLHPEEFDTAVPPLITLRQETQVIITHPCPGQRPYFLFVPTQGKPFVSAERQIPLAGDVNFRDLGGYQTDDGRVVKWGQLYRAGELKKLTKANMTYLAHLGLNLICDFRVDYEVEKSPDPPLNGAVNLRLPMKGGNMPIASLYEAISQGDLATIDTDHLIAGNRLFIRRFTSQYADMLAAIREENGRPALIHCTAGKDRTGLGAAILLWVLGVPMETVFTDYMLSNTYRAVDNARILQAVGQNTAAKKEVPVETLDLSPLQALLEVRRMYLQTAVDTILADYGSITTYIRKGLGMSSDSQRAFQDALLYD